MRKVVSTILVTTFISSTIATPTLVLAQDKKPTQTEDKKEPTEEEKKEQERIKSVMDEGSKKGEELGKQHGEKKGKRDAINENKFDWEKAYKELGDITKFLVTGGSSEYLKGFLEGFKKGFEKAYGDAYMEILTKKIEVNFGVAKEMGERDAISDFNKGLTLDTKRNGLTDKEIISKFKIEAENESLIEEFIVLFRVEYEEAYKEKFWNLRTESIGEKHGAGYTAGENLGKLQGSQIGNQDFITPGKSNDWEREFRKFELQKSLEDRYFLYREPDDYREGFVIGFREGFRDGYTKAYQKTNIEVAEKNINYHKVSMFEETIEFEEVKTDYEKGQEKDNKFNNGELYIPEGTFYRETYIGLAKQRETFNYHNFRYEPATHVYSIIVGGDYGFIDLRKPIKLTIPFYDDGAGRGGIYQYINGQWRYLYTEVSEYGKLSTEIPATRYTGGQYAIFIDEEYRPLEDIGISWAHKELKTFARRHYINGNGEGKFNPSYNISRADFLTILGRVAGWKSSGIYNNTSKFPDVANNAYFKDMVNYATNNGYVSGFPDGTFKPYNAISYREIEWVMRKVLNDPQFKWDIYADKMLREKSTQSKGAKDKTQAITKAEIIYMLHELQKENKL